MVKVLHRLQPWLSLLLSLLGVLLAVAVGIYEGRWPAVVICAVIFVLVVLVVLYTEFWPRPSPTDTLVDGMLAVSVKPRHYPICSDSVGTNASGYACGALAALELLTVVRHVAALLDKRREEFEHEQVFSEETLLHHLGRCRRIHALLSGHLCSPAVEAAKLMPEALAVAEELRRIFEDLDSNIIRPQEHLVDALRDRQQHDQRIKNLLSADLPQFLRELRDSNRLSALESQVVGLVDRLRGSWDDARAKAWADPGCRPEARTPPNEPIFVQQFLDRIPQIG